MASPNKALTGLVSKVLKLSLSKSKSKPKPETLTQRYQDFARSEFGKGKEVESMLNEASKVKDSTKAYNNELEGLKKNYNEFNNPPVKMVSPLNGAYENPRFVDTERGQTASNIASKALLDGAVKKFNDPGAKSKRQAKRADRLDNRIERRDTRFRNKNEVKQSRALVSDILDNPKNIKGRKQMSKDFDKDVRKPFKEKTDKLKARSLKIKGKSDANKMIAQEINATKGLTDNQKAIYLINKRNKADESKNYFKDFGEAVKREGDTFKKFSYEEFINKLTNSLGGKPESKLDRFKRTGKTGYLD